MGRLELKKRRDGHTALERPCVTRRYPWLCQVGEVSADLCSGTSMNSTETRGQNSGINQQNSIC